MIEGRAARRILRQSDEVQREIFEKANPSMLNADQVARQYLTDGFITLHLGDKVIIWTSVAGLKKREQSPVLGGFTLEGDLQCSITDWSPKRVNKHAPERSGTLTLVPTSSRERLLRVEVGDRNQNIKDVLESDKMPESRKELATETHRTMLRAVWAELDDESRKLTEKIFTANPKLIAQIRKTRLDPSRIRQLVLTVGTDRHIDLPWR